MREEIPWTPELVKRLFPWVPVFDHEGQRRFVQFVGTALPQAYANYTEGGFWEAQTTWEHVAEFLAGNSKPWEGMRGLEWEAVPK